MRNSNRDIATKMFNLVDETKKILKCQCGTTRKQSGSGLTYLVNHIQTPHPTDYESILKEPGGSTQAPECILSTGVSGRSIFFYSKKRKMFMDRSI